MIESKRLSESRRICLIEELNLLTLVTGVFFRCLRYHVCYIVTNPTTETVKIIPTLAKLFFFQRLHYEHSPGLFYKAHEIACSTLENDILNNNTGFRLTFAMLNKILSHPLTEAALRKTFLVDYLLPHAKCLLFIQEIQRLRKPLIFLPRNAFVFSTSKILFANGLHISELLPRGYKMFSLISIVVGNLTTCLYGLGSMLFLLVQRPILLRTPKPQRWRIGVDSFNTGIAWEKPYQQFFLYDRRDLKIREVLHVIRNRLEERRTLAYYRKNKIPYIEASRLGIPLSYFFKTMLMQHAISTLHLTFQLLARRGSSIFLECFTEVLFHHCIRMELVDQQYPTDVFIARDEYGVQHILRTLLHWRRGGKTIGFNHGSVVNLDVSMTYFAFDTFCYMGQYHLDLLQPKNHFIKRSCVIGAGICGLDITRTRLKQNAAPSAYEAYRGKHPLVGVMGSDFNPDVEMSRSMMLHFYKTSIALLKEYPDMTMIIKPKTHEFETDREFMNLIREGGPRLIVDTRIWTYELLPLFDLLICAGKTTIGLEGLLLGIKNLYFDETKLEANPYDIEGARLVVRTEKELRDRVREILSGGHYAKLEVLKSLCQRHAGDAKERVVSKFRDEVYRLLDQVQDGFSIEKSAKSG